MWDVAFSPDGNYVATASQDGTARVWTLDGRTVASLEGHDGGVYAVAWTSDGNLMSASVDRTLRLWSIDGANGRSLRGHLLGIRWMAMSADGRLATCSSDTTSRLWDLAAGTSVLLRGHEAPVEQIAWSRDGQLVASAGYDATVRLWARDGGPLARLPIVPLLPPVTSRVGSVAIAPDGAVLACVHADERTMMVEWRRGASDSWHGRRLTEFDTIVCNRFILDRTGNRLLMACADLVARLVDRNGKTLVVYGAHGEHRAGILDAAFDPDERSVVLASADGTASVWSIDGRLEARLVGHTAMVNMARFSPDGQWIVTASQDGTARVFARDGTPIFHIDTGEIALNAALFSADGRHVLTAGAEGIVRSWPVDEAGLVREAQSLAGELTPAQRREFALSLDEPR